VAEAIAAASVEPAAGAEPAASTEPLSAGGIIIEPLAAAAEIIEDIAEAAAGAAGAAGTTGAVGAAGTAGGIIEAVGAPAGAAAVAEAAGAADSGAAGIGIIEAAEAGDPGVAEAGELGLSAAAIAPLGEAADARIQELTLNLLKMLDQLVLKSSQGPDTRREILGGVFASAASQELILEHLEHTGARPVAEYVFKGSGLGQVGSLVVSLMFKDEDVSAHTIALAPGLAEVAYIKDILPGATAPDGYSAYNVYVMPPVGAKHFSVTDGDAVLNVTLTAAKNESVSLTLILRAFDAAYYDDGYDGGDTAIQADEAFTNTVAATAIGVWSKYDVDRDRDAGSILDVNMVRQHLGAGRDPVTGWATALIGRCDIGGPEKDPVTGECLPDGIVDIIDLTLVLAKYNEIHG
jgi:hypothetical protein